MVTGLLFMEEVAADMHALNQTVQVSLYEYPCEQLCPGGAALDELMRELEQATGRSHAQPRRRTEEPWKLCACGKTGSVSHPILSS